MQLRFLMYMRFSNIFLILASSLLPLLVLTNYGACFWSCIGTLNKVMYILQVYTFGPTFRAENSNTSRHLAEFWVFQFLINSLNFPWFILLILGQHQLAKKSGFFLFKMIEPELAFADLDDDMACATAYLQYVVCYFSYL